MKVEKMKKKISLEEKKIIYVYNKTNDDFRL